VTVIARLASTHTALVSQSLVGLCFAFPSINQSKGWPLKKKEKSRTATLAWLPDIHI